MYASDRGFLIERALYPMLWNMGGVALRTALHI